MDKGHFSCGVSIDLQKAFDTVKHDRLLQKLDYCGFRGIINEWFSSYLRQRTQVTIVESQTFDTSSIDWCPTGFCARPATLSLVHYY